MDAFSEIKADVTPSTSNTLQALIGDAGIDRGRCSRAVVGIMVYPDEKYRRLALLSAEQFRRQTYPYKQLVIVNETSDLLGSALLRDDDEVVEVMTSDDPWTAACAAYGSAKAWFVRWDLRTYSHPQRLMAQMALRQDGVPNKLAYRLHLDVSAAVRSGAKPMHATVLSPSHYGQPTTLLSYGCDPLNFEDSAGVTANTVPNRGACRPGVLANIVFHCEEIAYACPLDAVAGMTTLPGERFPGVTDEDIRELPAILSEYGLSGEIQIVGMAGK